MPMKIINDNTDFFMSVTLTDWLAARGKTAVDVTEATLMAKATATDIDGDAKLSKTLGSGITASGDDFLVESESADFGTGKLEISGEYDLFFGVKFAGDTKFREIILRDSKLEVVQDGIRA